MRRSLAALARSLVLASFGGTSADMTTVNGFTIGAGGDALTFHVAAFGSGLTDRVTSGTIGAGTTAAAGDAFSVGFAGEHIPVAGQLVRVVLDEISHFPECNSLAHSLVTSTIGDFKLDFSRRGP